MRLHCDPAGASCRAILLFAAEAGIRLDIVVVDLAAGEHLSHAFGELNPARTVPVLEDGRLRLTDCTAILRHLAAKAPDPAWQEDCPRVQGLVQWFRHDFAHCFAHGLVYPRVMPRHGWPNLEAGELPRRRAERASRQHFDRLEEELRHSRGPYLGGTAPCLADYAGAGLVTLGELIDWDLSPWPAVTRWVAAMQARPRWAAVNGPFAGPWQRCRPAPMATAA